VGSTYKSAVIHRDNWFISLRPLDTNKAVVYINNAVELERPGSINEGMNTANRALNVLTALWFQDYVTAFIKNYGYL
jgi:hypothetical protein